jgi:hypothetical protein
MRRLLVILALVLAAPAAAATIDGTAQSDSIVGTQGADRIFAGAGNDFIQVAFGGVDSVDCGPGFDVVSADLADTVAANCEVVSRRLSVDLSTNPASQHETAVEPDDAAWGSTVVAAYQLGRFPGGAASNIGFAMSGDAGRTWQRGVLPGVTVESSPPGTQSAASDPTVAYDSVHGVWLIGTVTLEQGSSHVLVARSTDGVHWATPVVAATGAVLDKDWLTCDNGASSPFRGRCYLEYTDDQNNITVSESSDDGGATWSQPVTAGSILVGTQPVTLPDGTLDVVAGDYTDENGLTGSIVDLRSTDGGATFTRVVVSDLTSRANDVMRSIALPSVEADSAGTIYAVWHDCRFRPGCAENDVVLSTSKDGGLTWSPPSRVPDGPVSSTLDAFITGLGADPAHPGHLAVVYAYFHPGSCARGTCLLGAAVQQSSDGGVMWSPPQRLDAQPMQETWLARAEGGRMVGDYYSVEFAGNRVVPVFALAAPPLNGRFREAIFATSLPALG